MFGRATIRLGIGPHSSFLSISVGICGHPDVVIGRPLCFARVIYYYY